jgi:hypothetical protein
MLTEPVISVVENKGSEQTTTTPSVQDGTLDYKALLEKERADRKKDLEEKDALKTRLGQAEFKLIEKSREKKRKEANQEDGKEYDEEGLQIDKESIAAELKEENRKEMEKFKMEQVTDTIEDELAKIADPDERELTRLKYENGIVRTGYTRAQIQIDLRNARLLANGPRLEKTLSEIKQTVIAKQTAGTASGASEEIKTETKLSDADEVEVQRIAKRTNTDPKIVRVKLLANK